MASADTEKKTRHGSKKSSSSKSPLVDHEELFHAVEGFIRANTNFESSVPVNTAIEMIANCTSLQDLFTLVLQRQLLNMDGALHWALFLSLAPARAEEAGDRCFSAAAPFSATAALALIASVYDLGVQEVVAEHFEYDSESDEEEDEDEVADSEETPQ